jgi:murein DD-endopeptidase MepM/ murein hydrolase activator NlpD
MSLPTQISLLDQSQRVADVKTRDESALREAAMQFEALFLMQLTAALGPSNDDGEDNLFGSDAGTNLSRQMFSEQMATVMAQAGGIGLAESLLRQFQLAKSKTAPSARSEKPQAFEAARAIRDMKPNPKVEAKVETKVEPKVEAKFEAKVENKTILQNIANCQLPVADLKSVISSSSPKVLSETSPINEKLPYYSVTSEYANEAKAMEKTESVKYISSDIAKPARPNSRDEIYIVSEADEKDIAASVAFEQSAPTNPYLKSFYPKSSARSREKGGNSVAEIPTVNKTPKVNNATPVDVVGNVTKTSVATDAKPTQSSSVELRWPVRGRLSSHFGYRRDPFHGKHKFHSGLDIAAPRGTPIGASADGVVVFAGWGRKYGNYVVVEHADGRRTKYAHADKLLVTEGEMVQSGQAIATVGSTGRATGPHLHFEVIEKGRAVNPIKSLSNVFRKSSR